MMRRAAPLPFALTLLAAACGSSNSSGADGGTETAADAGAADASNQPVVCIPRTDDNPDGLKDVKYLDSSETVYPQSDWRIALEPDAEVHWGAVADLAPHEAVMLFDLSQPDVELAGFLVSRTAATDDAPTEAHLMENVLRQVVSAISQVSARSSGSNIQSLDGFDVVVGMTLDVVTSSTTDVVRLREAVLPALLGRSDQQVSFPDVGWHGGNDRRFVITMQVLHRGEADQVLLVGSVARASDYEDRHRKTALHGDDFANGTNLTVSLNGEARECEDRLLDKQAMADVIWLDDESITMRKYRENVATHATTFFERAELAGLDFRMGVTETDDGKEGIFASREAASPSGDRWLYPGDLAEFQENINNPSGPDSPDGALEHGLTAAQATLDRHLPRSDSDPSRIRPDASLTLILMTDERAQELEDAEIFEDGSGMTLINAEQAAAVETMVAPLKEHLEENRAVFHLIGVPESGGCVTEIGYGYFGLVQATGGQFGSICQAGLGPTIDSIIEQIIGEASPIQLDYVPISSSITVMRDGVPVPRSRERGWDFRRTSNSIVFFDMPVDPANPADIVIGYRRWQDQVVE